MDSKNIKYFGVGGLLEDALALMKKVSYESYKKPLTATTIELNQVAKLSKEQWDKIYFDTIKKYGEDSQEVKNIRDLHFSVMSGGDDLPKKYTHYTPSEPFNIYDFDHKPTSDGGFRGKGAYFETSETGTKDNYKGHPLEAYLRMNYTVDGKAVGAIPGQMDGPEFLQMLGHYKTKQEAIDHYLEEAKQKILQDIEYSKQNSLASKIKLKQEGIDPTTSKEKLNKQISDYLERMEKDLKKKIPDDFDKIDSYQDSYETVVYNAGQMKSPQAVTRDDEGNIIPLSQRDDFSNPDMRFKDGGIIKAQDGTKFLVIKDEPEFDYEEPEFNFRHLNDELEAQDLDNYLTDLYYQKRIKYGQPDKDAIQEIQRHYNLSKDQIQETFDDLYNYGLGRVLTADLEDHPIEDVIPNAQQIDDETVVLKNGGQLIPKAASGVKMVAKTVSDFAEESAGWLIHYFTGNNVEDSVKLIKEANTNGALNKGLSKAINNLESGGSNAQKAYEKYYEAMKKSYKRSQALLEKAAESSSELNTTNYLKGVARENKFQEDYTKNLYKKYPIFEMQQLIQERKAIPADLLEQVATSQEGQIFFRKLQETKNLHRIPDSDLATAVKWKQGQRQFSTNLTTKIDNTGIPNSSNQKPLGSIIDDMFGIPDFVTKGVASGKGETATKSMLETYKKLAASTNNTKLDIIAQALQESHKSNIELPEEFMTYLRSIIKIPGNTAYGHLGEFKTTTDYSQLTNFEIDQKLNEAIKALKDINAGTFKPSKAMLKENHIKGGGVQIHPEINKKWTDLQRKIFNEEEEAEAFANQLGDIFGTSRSIALDNDTIYNFAKTGKIPPQFELNYHGKQIADIKSKLNSSTLTPAEKEYLNSQLTAYMNSNHNIDDLHMKAVILQQRLDNYAALHGQSSGIITLVPRYGTTKTTKGKIVNTNGDRELTFAETPSGKHLLGFDFMIDKGGWKKYEIPEDILTSWDLLKPGSFTEGVHWDLPKDFFRVTLEQHHSKPLSQMMSEAYIGALNEAMQKGKTSVTVDEVVDYYKSHRPTDFAGQFLLLTKDQHIGRTNGVHKTELEQLTDLARKKSLAQTGLFRSQEDLDNFYKEILAERSAYMLSKGDASDFQRIKNILIDARDKDIQNETSKLMILGQQYTQEWKAGVLSQDEYNNKLDELLMHLQEISAGHLNLEKNSGELFNELYSDKLTISKLKKIDKKSVKITNILKIDSELKQLLPNLGESTIPEYLINSKGFSKSRQNIKNMLDKKKFIAFLQDQISHQKTPSKELENRLTKEITKYNELITDLSGDNKNLKTLLTDSFQDFLNSREAKVSQIVAITKNQHGGSLYKKYFI